MYTRLRNNKVNVRPSFYIWTPLFPSVHFILSAGNLIFLAVFYDRRFYLFMENEIPKNIKYLTNLICQSISSTTKYFLKVFLWRFCWKKAYTFTINLKKNTAFSSFVWHHWLSNQWSQKVCLCAFVSLIPDNFYLVNRQNKIVPQLNFSDMCPFQAQNQIICRNFVSFLVCLYKKKIIYRGLIRFVCLYTFFISKGISFHKN